MLLIQHQDHPLPSDYIGCIPKGFPPELWQCAEQVVNSCLGSTAQALQPGSNGYADPSMRDEKKTEALLRC